MNDDSDWVPTDVTDPGVLDKLLDRNNFLIDRYNKVTAWHKGQLEWHHDQFVIAEARAVMHFDGPATLAKASANADEDVILARTQMTIAKAQLGVCEHRLAALGKEAMTLAARAKLLTQTYHNGKY
jgi:hypothetical protein